MSTSGCEIIYSNRIMFTRFASCDTHGWMGKWRWFRREKRDAIRHVQMFAELDGQPVQYTESVTTDPRPTLNWRVIGVSFSSSALLIGLTTWLATR